MTGFNSSYFGCQNIVPGPGLPHHLRFIAATALVHGMTVITRNVADFERTGVPLLNPWDTI